MKNVALYGAGGKMGVRLASNLKESDYKLQCVEISQERQAALLKETGLDCVSHEAALEQAEAIILAVPDKVIGKALAGFVDELKPGTAVVMLDAAAQHADTMPKRDDITYFIAHPCHPPVFSDETDPEAQKDYFGCHKAKQHIVCALAQGPEAHYALCEELARTFYAPVMRSHRLTVEQLAILEPGLAESIGATFALALAAATKEAERRGVPYQAAEDFLLGHMRILLAVAFGHQPGGSMSEGCLQAIEEARPVIFKEQWIEKILAPEAIKASVQSICK